MMCKSLGLHLKFEQEMVILNNCLLVLNYPHERQKLTPYEEEG